MSTRLVTRRAPLRFVLFCAVFVVALVAGIAPLGWGRATLAAFDLAALVFLLSVWPLLDNPAEQMRRAARDNDANRTLLLIITFVVTLVVLVAVGAELRSRHSFTLALVLATLPLAWLFSNVVYALHYANLYYRGKEDGKDKGGIDFPGTGEPTYPDFIYFSFTLGMTFQTSDTAITTSVMRGVVTGHCLAAFVFNIGVLAFTINVLGGG